MYIWTSFYHVTLLNSPNCMQLFYTVRLIMFPLWLAIVTIFFCVWLLNVKTHKHLLLLWKKLSTLFTTLKYIYITDNCSHWATNYVSPGLIYHQIFTFWPPSPISLLSHPPPVATTNLFSVSIFSFYRFHIKVRPYSNCLSLFDLYHLI